jgi:hypothetical protein
VPRRLAAAAASTLLAFVLAGCEDATEHGARGQVQAYLRRLPNEGGYDVDRVSCTHAARMLLDPVRTTRAFCTAPRSQTGDCDWFRIDAGKDTRPTIVLVRRNATCVLPAG